MKKLLLIALTWGLYSMYGGVKRIYYRMAAAIQEFEGFFPDSRAWRNNNPGNLKYAGQPGATGMDETGHAIFDSFQSGWTALINQLKAAFEGRSAYYSPDDSLMSFFNKYAESNSTQYAQFVAGRLGVSPDTKLRELENL